jgi:elongation factor 1-beta
MTGIAAVIVKIMPDSPEANLDEIKSKAIEALEQHGSKNISIEEEPIAFGLSSLKVKFAWPEEKDTDLIQNSLEKISHVTSITIEDYRRAFG